MSDILSRVGLSREDVQRLAKKYAKPAHPPCVSCPDDHEPDPYDEIFAGRITGGDQVGSELARIRSDYEGGSRFG